MLCCRVYSHISSAPLTWTFSDRMIPCWGIFTHASSNCILPVLLHMVCYVTHGMLCNWILPLLLHMVHYVMLCCLVYSHISSAPLTCTFRERMIPCCGISTQASSNLIPPVLIHMVHYVMLCCLLYSHISSAPLTCTFRERMIPCWGISTQASSNWINSTGIPLFSFLQHKTTHNINRLK